MGENRKGSWFSLSETRLAFNIGPTWQNHSMKSVHSGGIQQCLFLLAPHLWFSNTSGDTVKLQKKGAEVFWGFLPAFWHIAIEGLSDDRVIEALTSERKSSRSSSNLGNSCKTLSTILYRKSSLSLSIIAQNFWMEPEKLDPWHASCPITSQRTKHWYLVLIFYIPQMPMLLLLMWGKEQRGCWEVFLNFPSVLGGVGMWEGMSGTCSPSLERIPVGEAMGLGNRLSSARHACRPLCAASLLGESQQWGSLCGHSFSNVSWLHPLCPWVGSAWRVQMKELLSLHSGC